MMNLTGMPGIAVQVGRMASWVATRELDSRPCIGMRAFLYSFCLLLSYGKLGGTARIERCSSQRWASLFICFMAMQMFFIIRGQGCNLL